MIPKYGAGFILLLKAVAALEVSPDGTCGGVQQYTCAGYEETDLACCSQYGWCGSTDGHCGYGCQSEFGTCNDTSVLQSSSFTTLFTVTKTSDSALDSESTPLSDADASTLSVDVSTAADAASTSIDAEPTLLDVTPTSLVVSSTPLAVASPSSTAASTTSAKAASSSAGANAQSCTCSSTVSLSPTCPSSDGACYTINGKTFSISCGGLAEGDIIGYPPILSLSTCISTCSMLPNCVAVSFHQDGPPECALLSKYTGPSTVSEAGTKSVARLQGASCK